MQFLPERGTPLQNAVHRQGNLVGLPLEARVYNCQTEVVSNHFDKIYAVLEVLALYRGPRVLDSACGIRDKFDRRQRRNCDVKPTAIRFVAQPRNERCGRPARRRPQLRVAGGHPRKSAWPSQQQAQQTRERTPWGQRIASSRIEADIRRVPQSRRHKCHKPLYPS